MTKLYPCSCKFCGVELSVEIEDDYLALRHAGASLLPAIPDLTRLAACNRCADYANAKNRIRERMGKVAHILSIENFANRGGSDAARNAREVMRALYDKWFTTVCDFLLIETQTDASFVSIALEHPERWAQWFGNYERGCKGIAQNLKR
jgi:hypothetical protein